MLANILIKINADWTSSVTVEVIIFTGVFYNWRGRVSFCKVAVTQTRVKSLHCIIIVRVVMVRVVMVRDWRI